MMKMGITVDSVTKKFGKTTALDNISVNFDSGKIYGLLGNNGAGKTTLLNIITNRIFADTGKTGIDGENVESSNESLRKVYMMGELNLYPEDMRVGKAFKTTKLFYPDFDAAYAASIAEKFGLNTKKKITSLSTGYASIFKLVIALSANTPYIIFDEPVLGLDAQHRDMFYKLLLEKYSRNNPTVIISTHLIQEIADIVENIVIIRNGKILRDAPCDQLTADSWTVSGPTGITEEYIKDFKVLYKNTLGGLETAFVEGKPGNTPPPGLEITKTKLQDYYISLMNGEDMK